MLLTCWLVLAGLLPVRFARPYSKAGLLPLPAKRRLIWLRQFSLDDPNNWREKELPCPQDRVVLPENHVTFLGRKLVTSELILPENGQLVISNQGGGIEFFLFDEHDEQLDSARCGLDRPARTVYFEPDTSEQLFSWFDPANWHLSFEFESIRSYPYSQLSNYATFHRQSRLSRYDSLIPDSERIPCSWDFVDFPTNGSWKVVIGTKSHLIPRLESVSIGPRYQFRTSTFRRFASSFLGQLLFDVHGYNHMEIEPRTGCTSTNQQCGCGNDQPKRLDMICRFRSCPDTFLCRDPIQPAGFCCPVCAASLLIQLKRPAVPELAHRLHQKLLAQLSRMYAGGAQISLYAHWLWNGSMQVVLRDLDPPNGQTSSFASQLDQALASDAILARATDRFRQASDNWISDSSLLDSIWFFMFLILALVGAIGYVLYIFHTRNRQDPAFTFVRFRSSASDVELELDNPGLAGPDVRFSAAQGPVLGLAQLRNLPERLRTMAMESASSFGWSPAVIRLRSEEEDVVVENPVFQMTQTAAAAVAAADRFEPDGGQIQLPSGSSPKSN